MTKNHGYVHREQIDACAEGRGVLAHLMTSLPVRKPQPEETIEAPELQSLRSAAKQGELLPQRQVLEREVSVGFERRTERAQQNEYEGHCLLARMPLGHRPVFATGFWQTTAALRVPNATLTPVSSYGNSSYGKTKSRREHHLFHRQSLRADHGGDGREGGEKWEPDVVEQESRLYFNSVYTYSDVSPDPGIATGASLLGN